MREGVVSRLEELVDVVGDLLERSFEPACFRELTSRRRVDGVDGASGRRDVQSMAHKKLDLHTARNQSRAHWSVGSILFGKFWSVQTGIDFSGGSRVAP